MKSFQAFIKHLFVPHDGNNYRAKVLHVDFLSYYLIFVLFFSFGFKLINNASGDVLGYATDITTDKLLQLTNDVRSQNQLTPLSFNQQLTAAAQKKASDMFAKNYWSHYGPDGATPWDFILSSGYKYEFAGENLAKNFLFSQGVVDAWMASPSHKENILRNDYTEVGFAIVNGVLNGEETTLVVQMFGKPMSSTVAREPLPAIETEFNTLEVQAETPAEAEFAEKTRQTVLAQSTVPGASVRKFSFDSSLIFLSFLLVAFIMDLYFANKLRVVRITSKNLAHLIFIGFIFFGLFFIIQGNII